MLDAAPWYVMRQYFHLDTFLLKVIAFLCSILSSSFCLVQPHVCSLGLCCLLPQQHSLLGIIGWIGGSIHRQLCLGIYTFGF